MAVVETRNITKEFDGGAVKVVKDINIATADGEFLVLLGPSGCGKTTLLRMIGGLESPTSGDILIGDRVVTNLPPRAREIAMVFQSYALYPHMSVRNNIAFPLKAAKVPKPEQERRIAWASGILGIDQLLDRKPRQLSGGQRQRVALARALVREPNVFLLDEPLSNLDAQRRASARDELQLFQREIGTTTIYVTHDQVEAMGLGHRIAVIEGGRVRQIGTPREIYEEPSDTFVATFLGSPPMNLVPREDILLGFRPEKFYLPTDRTDAASTTEFLLSSVREEYLGSEKLVYGEVEGIRVCARMAANAMLPISEGESVVLAVNNADIRRFDRESGHYREAATPTLVSGAPA